MRIRLIVSSFIILILFSNSLAATQIQLNSFSLVAPEGWDIRFQKDNSIAFMTKKGGSDLGLIGASAREANSKLSFEDSWKEVKLRLPDDKTIVFEGEETVNTLVWKKIQYTHEKGQHGTTMYFRLDNNVEYMVQFFYQQKSYNKYLPVFLDFFKNIKFKSSKNGNDKVTKDKKK